MNCDICNCAETITPISFYIYIGKKAWNMCRHCYNEIKPADTIEWYQRVYCDGWTLWDDQARYLKGVHEVKRSFNLITPQHMLRIKSTSLEIAIKDKKWDDANAICKTIITLITNDIQKEMIYKQNMEHKQNMEYLPEVKA